MLGRFASGVTEAVTHCWIEAKRLSAGFGGTRAEECDVPETNRIRTDRCRYFWPMIRVVPGNVLGISP